MEDTYSQEKRTVDALFDEGKITAEERDRLLEALEASAEESKNRKGGDKPEDKAESGEKRSFMGRLVAFEDWLSGAIKDGLRSADDALNKASDSLRHAAHDLTERVSENLEDDDDGEISVRTREEKFDVPFETMTVCVKYKDRSGSVSYTEPAGNAAALIDKCRAVMADDAFEALVKLINKKFTGKYKYAVGDKKMRVTIRPEEDI